jgi:hypothetical protein
MEVVNLPRFDIHLKEGQGRVSPSYVP